GLLVRPVVSPITGHREAVALDSISEERNMSQSTLSSSAAPALEFEDRAITCVDCGEQFIWTAGEQVFFHDKGLKNEPKRCKPCKQAKNEDRKSTRLNSSHVSISYAVFCSKKKISTHSTAQVAKPRIASSWSATYEPRCAGLGSERPRRAG